MKRMAFLFGWLVLLLVAVGGCASTAQSNSSRFDGDPVQYLEGVWEGMVHFPSDKFLPERKLTIHQQPIIGNTIWGYYGVPGTRHQGWTAIAVTQYGGNVGIFFRTGSMSRVNLWLQKFGKEKELVLNGEIRTSGDGPPIPMALRKRK